MNAIAKVLNENVVGGHETSTNENVREFTASLDRLLELLKRPEYEPFIRFAIFWNELDALLAEFQLKIRQRLAEQPIETLEELHAILIEKK